MAEPRNHQYRIGGGTGGSEGMCSHTILFGGGGGGAMPPQNLGS